MEMKCKKSLCFFLYLISSQGIFCLGHNTDRQIHLKRVKRDGISSEDVQNAVDFNFGVDSLTGNLIVHVSIFIFETLGYSTAGKFLTLKRIPQPN